MVSTENKVNALHLTYALIPICEMSLRNNHWLNIESETLQFTADLIFIQKVSIP